jgi:virginiamycin B lyase
VRWILGGLALLGAGVAITLLRAADHGGPAGGRQRAPAVRLLRAVRFTRDLRPPLGKVVVTRNGRVWFAERVRTGAALGRLRGRAVVTLRWSDPPVSDIVAGAAPGIYLAWAAHREVGAVDRRGRLAARHRVAGDAVGVALDLFGALWFTDRRRAVLGRIAVRSGRISELRPRGSEPRLADIVLGPSSLLWFRDERGFVGIVEPNGRRLASRRIPGGRPSAGPSRLAGGPDGAVWFTSAGGVGRITEGGPARLIARRTRTGPVGAIVSGPDGNLWCLATKGPRMVRVAPDGGVTRYRLDLPAATRLVDVARDSHRGDLWITASRPAALLRVALPDLRAKL